MAVPRNRTSNARKNSRRSHHAKKPCSVLECRNCGGTRLSHTICNHCGWYQDKVVIEMRGEES